MSGVGHVAERSPGSWVSVSVFWLVQVSALLVFVGSQLAFGLRGFAMVNVFLVVVWVAIVIAIIHVRKDKAQTRIEDRAA